MRKRGLSSVITTLIMMLLVFVSVAIIWIVVKNLIISSSEDVDLERILVDLDIQDVENSGENLIVNVKRNPGKGDIAGLAFVIGNEIDSEVIKIDNVELNELEKKPFNLNYDGFIKEISVAPIFITKSGKEKIGNVVDILKFTDIEALKNMRGLVSWWRMSGNANDEMNLNNGIVNNVDFINDAEKGRVASFNGVNSYINVSHTTSLNFTNVSWIVFFKLKSLLGSDYNVQTLLAKDISGSLEKDLDIIWDANDSKIKVRHQSFNLGNLWLNQSSSNINIDEWHQAVFVMEYGFSKNSKLYIDGELQELIIEDYSGMDNIADFMIGQGFGGTNMAPHSFFNGSIDEVIIFNKSLSDKDVIILNSLDLR